MEEIWKDVVDYEGLYQVSNLGRVRSLNKKVSCKNNFFRITKGKIIKQQKSIDGYPQLTITNSGNLKLFKVHRLVALAFLPNPENKATVNHKNGIKIDNRIENLEWNTHSENQQHSYDIGLNVGRKGTKHHGCKLTEDQVKEIKYGHKGITQKDIAKMYGVGCRAISKIRTGIRWGHI